MSLNNVSTILWRERQLLELLLFKLDEEQLLLAAGRARWLAQAANEVETVLEEIKNAELARSIEVEAVADELGLGPDVSLGDLIDASPSPWNGIFADHRDAFLSMTQEILSVAGSNRELLDREHGGSEPEGTDLSAIIIEPRLRELAYNAALAATDRVVQSSLVDFLREPPGSARSAPGIRARAPRRMPATGGWN